ncbi:nucleotidyltransferase family protein [Agathobaculum faecis]|uniref:nucleotidyltransferase family protein n=1 Tax=Agathobaculum faecis TaxID=2763013 RepID=UPI001FABAF2E|nr:nucleotidyltransferase domain-containing protein [Agathobaculum faecis]
MDKLFSALAQLAHDCGAQKLTLFGSRARGDNHERSDIDLAVYGMPEKQQIAFLSGVDDLPTLLKFDIVFIATYTSPDLLTEIDRDGVILYEENQA